MKPGHAPPFAATEARPLADMVASPSVAPRIHPRNPIGGKNILPSISREPLGYFRFQRIRQVNLPQTVTQILLMKDVNPFELLSEQRFQQLPATSSPGPSSLSIPDKNLILFKIHIPLIRDLRIP